MKKICLLCMLLLMAIAVSAQNPNERRSGGITFSDDSPRTQRSSNEPIQVMLWASSLKNGHIAVYFNNRYVGTITRSYSSRPSCGAAGCVTVTVTQKSNSFYGVSSDGTRWNSEKATLRPGCNRIRLYSTGKSKNSNSSSSNRNSSSSGGSSSNQSPSYGNDDALSNSASELGAALGDLLVENWRNSNGWGHNSHRIDLGLGWGVNYGGLGLKLNYQAPVIFGVTAGYGYNLDYDSESENKKKMYWNAGLQLWLSDHWNMEFGAGPRYYKKFDATEVAVSFMINGQYPIYKKRWGILGGIGFSVCTNAPEAYKNDNCVAKFEWNIGIVYRLFCSD